MEFQNYRDCGYTCNPHKFEIPALQFPCRVPVIPSKHLQCVHTFDGVVEEPSKKPPKKYLETLIVGFGKTDVLGFSCCYLLTFHVAINDWTETGGERSSAKSI